jgi:hypothetical protein
MKHHLITTFGHTVMLPVSVCILDNVNEELFYWYNITATVVITEAL